MCACMCVHISRARAFLFAPFFWLRGALPPFLFSFSPLVVVATALVVSGHPLTCMKCVSVLLLRISIFYLRISLSLLLSASFPPLRCYSELRFVLCLCLLVCFSPSSARADLVTCAGAAACGPFISRRIFFCFRRYVLRQLCRKASGRRHSAIRYRELSVRGSARACVAEYLCLSL